MIEDLPPLIRRSPPRIVPIEEDPPSAFETFLIDLVHEEWFAPLIIGLGLGTVFFFIGLWGW